MSEPNNHVHECPRCGFTGGSSVPSLTKDEKLSIAIFARDKGDPTRWCNWQERLPAIQRDLPEFYFLWQAHLAAEKAFNEAAKQLEADSQDD